MEACPYEIVRMKYKMAIIYDDALKLISAHKRFGSKLGLHRMKMLMEKLGDPQDKLKFVHVAGTNGKGTTCTYIASVLRENGYKVGLYTSPYVVDFRERFQINGEMIEKETLVRIVERVSSASQEFTEDRITEFEFITAMAFLWFLEEKCDIVVLEVGLGGRYDGTNVIKNSEVSVITSISLDHTGILGNAVEEIAYEKAGIIKENSMISMYPMQNPKALEVFEKESQKKHSTISKTNVENIRVTKSSILGSEFSINGENHKIPFSGKHQVYNAVNAINALEILKSKGWNIENIDKGLEKSRIFARMEVVSENPLIIIDGGHNPECAEALREVIKTNLKNKKIIGVMGMMSDKDSETYLQDVAPLFSTLITVEPNIPRALTGESLAEMAKAFTKDIINGETCEKGIETALKIAMADDETAIIVCGSFYVASDVRKFLMKKSSQKNIN